MLIKAQSFFKNVIIQFLITSILAKLVWWLYTAPCIDVIYNYTSHWFTDS